MTDHSPPPPPSPPSGPPPGWYSDPEGPEGGLRWWDGRKWTDGRKPGRKLPVPAPGSEDDSAAAAKRRHRRALLIGLSLLAVLIALPYVGPLLPREPSPRPSPRCVLVSPAVLDGIGEGLTVYGSGELTRGYAVKSADRQNLWFVAAEISAPGMEDPGDIGLWAVGSPTEPGWVMAVDAMAAEFSDWGVGSETTAEVSQSEDGAQEARDCTEG